MNTLKHFTFIIVTFCYICQLQNNLVKGAPPHLAVDVPRLQTAQNVCRVKSGVSDAVFEAALNKNMDTNDRNLQCYTQCIFKEMGTMDENGNFKMESFVAELSKENQDAHGADLISCQSVDDKDLCVKGMKYYQCLQEKGGSKFYFV